MRRCTSYSCGTLLHSTAHCTVPIACGLLLTASDCAPPSLRASAPATAALVVARVTLGPPDRSSWWRSPRQCTHRGAVLTASYVRPCAASDSARALPSGVDGARGTTGAVKSTTVYRASNAFWPCMRPEAQRRAGSVRQRTYRRAAPDGRRHAVARWRWLTVYPDRAAPTHCAVLLSILFVLWWAQSTGLASHRPPERTARTQVSAAATRSSTETVVLMGSGTIERPR